MLASFFLKALPSTISVTQLTLKNKAVGTKSRKFDLSPSKDPFVLACPCHGMKGYLVRRGN